MTRVDTISRQDAMSASNAARDPRLIERAARPIVLRQLDRLKQGEVILSENGSSQSLGQQDHPSKANLTVKNPAIFAKSLLGGGLGFAESYIDGDWTTDNLTELLQIFVRNISVAHQHDRGIARLRAPLLRLGGFMKRNTKLGSRKNIAAHYDLGNEFFRLWLDDTMTYSSGIFLSDQSTMRDASIEKLDRICRALRLTPDDHVLETGTGWGSFAIHAASTYGCRVTTTTISKRQHEIAKQRVEAAGLSDRVTLLLKDYRDLEGAYDKLVSIEMIEAVGHNYLDTYLGACSRLLKPDGQMMLQVISMPDQRYKQYLRTSDFIRTHVFPGSCCPSLGALSASIARSTDMRCVRYEDITGHYARTLHRWHERFNEQIDAVRELGYPDRFIRLWDYYLSYCEAGFAERYIGVGQMLLNKPGCRASVIGGDS